MNQLNRLADQPWQNVIGIAILAAALYYFMLFDNGANQDAMLAQMTSELAASEKTLKETQEKMKDLEKFRAQLSDLEAQVAEVMQFIPKEVDLIGLIRMVQESAKQAGLVVRETKTDPKTERKEFYEMQKVNLTLQGTYVEFTRFLSLLSKLPRLVIVDSMKLRTSLTDPGANKGPVPRLDFDIAVIGYRYVGDPEPPAKTAAGGVGGG